MSKDVGREEEKIVIDDTSGDLRPFPWDSLGEVEDKVPSPYDDFPHIDRPDLLSGPEQEEADTKVRAHDGQTRYRVQAMLLAEADTKQASSPSPVVPPGWESIDTGVE